jgi:hypothetical protein
MCCCRCFNDKLRSHHLSFSNNYAISAISKTAAPRVRMWAGCRISHPVCICLYIPVCVHICINIYIYVALSHARARYFAECIFTISQSNLCFRFKMFLLSLSLSVAHTHVYTYLGSLYRHLMTKAQLICMFSAPFITALFCANLYHNWAWGQQQLRTAHSAR